MVFWVGTSPTTSRSSPVLILPALTRAHTATAVSWPNMRTPTLPYNCCSPCSTLPVTTVPLPEMLNTSSTGIRKGLSVSRTGVGIDASTYDNKCVEQSKLGRYERCDGPSIVRTASMRARIASLPSLVSPPVAAASADPLI